MTWPYGPGRLWQQRPLKRQYEVVIIGGGIHGLATAYYLAKEHGVKDVAVLESQYLGFGGSGRNTAIVRANQRTQQSVRLYDEGLKLWPILTDELDFNLMFFNCGNLNLAHSEAAVGALRLAINTASHCGVGSELLDPQQCKEVIPALDISDRPTYPIFGGMYHPPRGDRAPRRSRVGAGQRRQRARRRHPPGSRSPGHRGRGSSRIGSAYERGRDRVRETGGHGRGIRSPDLRHARHGAPCSSADDSGDGDSALKPFLHHVVSSGAYHVYANQTLKGEIATGAHMDPQVNYTTDVTAYYLKHQAEALADILPCLKQVRFLRIWSGLADMTPDMAPILDGNVMYEGLYLDLGWGYFGFKSGPVTGKYMAEFIARQETPDILAPFALSRFLENRYTGETATVMKYGHWD